MSQAQHVVIIIGTKSKLLFDHLEGQEYGCLQFDSVTDFIDNNLSEAFSIVFADIDSKGLDESNLVELKERTGTVIATCDTDNLSATPLLNHETFEQILLLPCNIDIFSAVLSKAKQQIINIKDLNEKINTANHMAMNAMESTGLLGNIIQFANQSQDCKTISELIDLTRHVVEQYKVTVSFRTSSHTGTDYHVMRRKHQAILSQHRQGGRIVDFDNETLINYTNISAYFCDLPEDPEHSGQLRDSFVTLLGEADERVKTIDLENEVESSNKTREQILMVISHELRTPLNAVIGFSNLLRQKKEGSTFDSNDIQKVERVHDRGSHLLSMVEGLLNYITLTSNKATINIQNQDISTILKDTCATFNKKAEEKELSFFSTLGDTAILADIDGPRIKQIIEHLVDNAIKFTEKGYVGIQLSTEINDLNEAFLQLTVEDSGIGIAETDIEKIFEPFSQVDMGINRSYEGIGMGLSLTRALTTLHKGTLSVDSQLGKGSQFKVRIPIDYITSSSTVEVIDSQELFENTELF